MLLQELQINRENSWGNDPPKPLQGKVRLEGPHGRIEIKLSPMAIGQIIGIIAMEAGITAKRLGKEVDQSLVSASNEHILIGNLEGSNE